MLPGLEICEKEMPAQPGIIAAGQEWANNGSHAGDAAEALLDPPRARQRKRLPKPRSSA